MAANEKLVDLINRTKNGDREAMSQLTQVARDRLLPYIHRLTLNLDVAEDILQEVLLQILKSINELEKPGSFWNWIFKTAKGKVLHYYRDRRHETEINRKALKQGWDKCEDSSLTGYNFVLRKEVTEAVIESISKLSIYHRTVVALRCYENLPYSQIADVLGCKEINARILMLRAKKKMKKDLVRFGFGTEYLLMALGLFGAITAKGKTTYVSASLLNVGALAVMISALSSRIAMVLSLFITSIGVLVTTKSFYYVIGITFISLYILFWFTVANTYKS